MSQQHTDEEGRRAKATMRRALRRADPEYAQRDRDGARERMRRLRGTPIDRTGDRDGLAHSNMSNAIGNRPYRRVYDSWYTLRRRALQAGEPEETILTLEQWTSIVGHYGGICLCCGNTSELTFDHVLPVSMGGTFTATNIQPLCLSCNVGKKNRYIDYRPDGGAFAIGSFRVR